MSKHVGIIGGGIAGLAAGALLSKNGYQVTILEKNGQAGGRARTWQEEGFAFDMGPSWYWMPEVFENFFSIFGKTCTDFYELKRLDPSYKVVYKEKTVDVPAGIQPVLDMFESLEPGAKKKVGKFLQKAGIKYHTAMQHYISKPSLSALEYFDLKILTSVFKLNLFTSIKKEIENTTGNSYIRQILEFPVLFLGSIPAGTPALYSMMNYVDTELGTWYPMGGMRRIIDAMLQIADEQGVEIKTGEEVMHVEVKNNRITLVKTNQGAYHFDHVINAAD